MKASEVTTFEIKLDTPRFYTNKEGYSATTMLRFVRGARNRQEKEMSGGVGSWATKYYMDYAVWKRRSVDPKPWRHANRIND